MLQNILKNITGILNASAKGKRRIESKVLRLILFSKIFLVMLGGDRMIGEKKIKKEVNTGSGL